MKILLAFGLCMFTLATNVREDRAARNRTKRASEIIAGLVPPSYLYHHSQLSALPYNELLNRRRERPAPLSFIIGDQFKCKIGRCEFFLFCWVTGGTIEKSCGGFLFICCKRSKSMRGNRGSKLLDGIYEESGHNNLREFGPVVNYPGCGTLSVKLSRRVVGGEDAGFGEVPWQAHIKVKNSRCGGSLISNKHVVTAGHCVVKASPKQVTVTLGDYVLNSDVEPLPKEKFGVTKIDVHPRFKYTPQADRFDIAVLTLDRDIQFKPNIRPVCLPEKFEDFEGEIASVAGWGAVKYGSKHRPKHLQIVEVPVISNHECESWHLFKLIRIHLTVDMLCAGYKEGGSDACQGDSGGPLLYEKNSKWYLIGIVSAGYSCALPRQPGIYHRVASSSDWVSFIVNS